MAGRRPGASLGLGPLDLVFLEAALAADLITASWTDSGSETSKDFSRISDFRNIHFEIMSLDAWGCFPDLKTIPEHPKSGF